MGTLYDTDIVAWASEQAELLRAGKWDALDLEHIAEEIEDVGKSEKRELRSRLAVLAAHLLKWKYQPGKRSKSWVATIEVQRTSISLALKATPSLKHLLFEKQWLKAAWIDALSIAIADTGLHDLPGEPVWEIGDVLDESFLLD